MEAFAALLGRGQVDAAWDLFVSRYRRLIMASIRHYAQDYDDVMDVFAHVCEALREDDCRRLRAWTEKPEHRARFSTWLVTVVRNLTVDWFRHRDGRRRLTAAAAALPGIQQQIVALIALDGHGHREAYELVRARDFPALTFREFGRELRAAYRFLSSNRQGSLLRDRLGGPLVEADAIEPAPSGDEDLREQAELALGALKPEERAAVQLYVLEELPAADVARIAGLANAKAVYNLVYRALAAMRGRLERAGFGREDG